MAQIVDPAELGTVALNDEEAYRVNTDIPVVTHMGKEIYIPKDLREMDLNDPKSTGVFRLINIIWLDF